KSKPKSLDVIYSHHLRVDICYVFINLHLQELTNCFNVVSSDLLLGMTSLNSVSSFGGFDKNMIMILTEYYKNEFDSNKFFNLKRSSNFAKVLVKSNLHQTWLLVYLLINLTLILRVATVSVERAFSSMKYIKNICNSIDQEQRRVNSEKRTKFIKFVFNAIDPNETKSGKKSIGIKEISKKVPRWSHKLITELDQQMGEFQDRASIDHQLRSRKAKHVVIFCLFNL
ncbi:hypothetical protein H5410_042544, partial [Solanum commersonii]